MFPSFIALITLYIIVIGLSTLFYFKFNDDVWLQGLWIITGVLSFVFLLVTSYFITHIQMDNPIAFERITPDGIDIDTNDYIQEFFNNDETYHYYYFDTNLIDQYNIKKAEICFRYNNTDGDNVVEIVGGIYEAITPQIYLDNIVGEKCVQIINLSCITNCNFIGFNCIDCTNSNGIYLLKDNNSDLVEEIEINVSTTPVGIEYSIDNEKAHLMWINARLLPKKEVKDTFFIYLWILGFLLLSFASWGVIKILNGLKEELEDDLQE